jgi:hypothetical protein
MLCGGLAGGLVYQWRPKLAQHPATGFGLTLAVSFLRRGIFLLSLSNAGAVLHRCGPIGMAPALEGLGTALILAIVAQVRDRDEQTRTAISAEVRDGQGIPATEVEKVFFAERPRVHALALLRRRLQGLFGSSFHLEVGSEFGRGTTVTIRMPLRKQVEVGGRSLEGKLPNLAQMAPNESFSLGGSGTRAVISESDPFSIS